MGSSPSNSFNKSSTAEEVCQKFGKQSGKSIVITGGSGGLGLECARVLCKSGAKVMITCRTESQGIDVVNKIKKELGDTVDISFGIMDLQDLESVKSFCKSFTSSKKPLHILINNAGVMACPLTKTKQGFELQFGVNHLGHFYLTKSLLPVLNASGTKENKSRVINVSSLGNWLYGPPTAILYDDINGDKYYHKWQRYGQSKLANILFSNELNRRCEADNLNVISVSLHPGVILETSLARHNNLLGMVSENVAYHWKSPSKLGAILFPYMKNTSQGAATTIYTALEPNIQPGKWYLDCQLSNDYLHPLAFDVDTSKKLWNFSEELIKPYL